jgi:D-alanyl-D-alanine dipeptidase
MFAHIFDHCPHVDMRAIDVCAYDKTKVKLDAQGMLDMKLLADCSSKKLGAGQFHHPCGCRHPEWTPDIHKGSKRAKIFTHGGVEEQQAMAKALRAAGFEDDVSNEWWHFHYKGP